MRYKNDNAPEGFRTCTKCTLVKPLDTDNFRIRKDTGKFRWECNSCKSGIDSAYYVANSEEIKDRTSKYRTENAEWKKQYDKNYYETHKDAIKAYGTQYGKQFREEINAKRRTREAPRRQDINTKKRTYYKNNIGSLRLSRRNSERKRRVLKFGNLGAHSKEDIKALLVDFNHTCGTCLKKLNFGYEEDHWYPICRWGSDSIENIVPLCKDCNIRKGSRTPIELFVEYRLFIAHPNKHKLKYEKIKPLKCEPQEPLDVWDYVVIKK
jgi:5-methylcytosine-specific restriction endonuclease McrA